MSKIPNWASDALVTTNPAIIKKIKETHEAGKDLLGAFFPMPQELRGIYTGATRIPNGQMVNAWREIDGVIIPMTDEEQASLVEKYGAKDWYDWSVANWGTKWDADIHALDITTDEDGTERAHVLFNTAWAPPARWFVQLIEQYPEGRTELAYAEGGMSFFGLIAYEDGHLVEEWQSEAFWGEQPEDEDAFVEPTTICQAHLDRYSLHVGG